MCAILSGFTDNYVATFTVGTITISKRRLSYHHNVQNSEQSMIDINLSKSHLQPTDSITRGHPL